MFSLGGDSLVRRVGRLWPPMTSMQPVLRLPGGGPWGTMVTMGDRTPPDMGAITLPLSGPRPTPLSCVLIRFCRSQYARQVSSLNP